MSKTRQSAPSARMGNTRQPKAQAQTRAPRKVMQTLAPRDALQLLESAVSYCQQAGIQIYVMNALEGLRFYLPQAELVESTNGGAAFRLAEETAPMLRTADATN